MSLDALAPDQRAVVQLVLQQDRSYEDLASMLGISAEAVRARAHAGIAKLAPGGGLDEADQGEVTDYLLGQQSVSGREATRSLLSADPSASAWARDVAAQLEPIARSPLPEIPEGAPEEDLGGPFVPDETETEEAPLEPEPFADPEPEAAPVRARARPRPRRGAAAETAAIGGGAAAAARGDDTTGDGDGDGAGAVAEDEPIGEDLGPATPPPRDTGAPRSRLGGALLIGGLAILLAALVVWLVAPGDDDEGGESASNGTTTEESSPTPTATPNFQPVGQVRLRAPDGGEARGRMIVYASDSGDVVFQLTGTKVAPTPEGEAYAVWLVGGPEARRLGYAPAVRANGRLGTSGPQQSDQQSFADWLTEAKQVIVSRETTQDATEPGPAILSGNIEQGSGAGSG